MWGTGGCVWMSGWSAVDACAGPLCACACAQRRQRSGRCSPSLLREGPRTQVSAGHRRPVTRTLRPPAGEEVQRGARVPPVHGGRRASPEVSRLGRPRGLGSNRVKGGRGLDEIGGAGGGAPSGQRRSPALGGSRGRGDSVATRAVWGPRWCSAPFLSPFQNHRKGKSAVNAREKSARVALHAGDAALGGCAPRHPRPTPGLGV